jgi:hypothetical protein
MQVSVDNQLEDDGIAILLDPQPAEQPHAAVQLSERA